MDNYNFSIQEAKQVDMEYLEKLGYSPQRINKDDYWYLSPLRDENTPSFKVNQTINFWYDFGLGEGGTIIDFGIKYFKCTVKEHLERLKASNDKIHQPSLSFHPHEPKFNSEGGDESKIKILDAHSIKSAALIKYINSRSINLEVAKQYCQEVTFELHNRAHTAIGFKNDTGGYELRNECFKGSSSPKFTMFICSHEFYKDLIVFEGFFDFLAYKTMQQTNQTLLSELPESQASFLILNSLSFFEMSRCLMERHERVKLFLDRDNAGIQHTQRR